MSNIKNRDYISVVLGGNIPGSWLLPYAVDHMGEDIQFPVTVGIGSSQGILMDCTEGLEDDRIHRALDLLNDWIATETVSSWAVHHGGYEIDNDSSMWVDVWIGTVRMGDILVQVTYLYQ